ncbi:hypothetical protein Tco_1356436 [Tanacetum coccineum]
MLLQKSSPPASVKAVEEICVTYGGPHSYHQCLATDGNVFLKYQDNIKGYVSAAAQTQVAPSNELSNYKKIDDANIKAMQNQINNVKNELRNEMNKPVVSKVSANTSSSTTACPSEMAALTDVLNAMLRHVKTSPPETVKAISESCVTCGGTHPYYECLAADSNTFNASAAAATYNQN